MRAGAASSSRGGERKNALPALTTPRMPCAASRPLTHWTSVMPGTSPRRSWKTYRNLSVGGSWPPPRADRSGV